eukprot:COSAG06_NODE_42266_length_383_cov_0.911972_1_plen_82_part_01
MHIWKLLSRVVSGLFLELKADLVSYTREGSQWKGSIFFIVTLCVAMMCMLVYAACGGWKLRDSPHSSAEQSRPACAGSDRPR